MYTRVLALFAFVTLVRGNDVIVGLKTDGRKFFDENRQANPALWRQMDNVTIIAPENEVISRVVITDLRPEKDGDVKIVDGGEGHKNVTIELKSPTVFRGYEFKIEVFSSPEGEIPLRSGPQSTTENTHDDPSKTTAQASTNPQTNIDNTSKLPDLSTDKNIPAILTKDEEITDNEREGRNIKSEDTLSEGSTESTSTTFRSDMSTLPTTQITENANEKHSEFSSTVPSPGHSSTFPPIPLYKSFNVHPAIPAASGKDNTENKKTQEETRHVRDTEAEKSGNPTDKKVVEPTNVHPIASTTENDEETTTTETSDIKPIEEKSEDTNKETDLNAPRVHTLENHKFTSFIPSKSEHTSGPIPLKNGENLRNTRDANEQKMYESLSTTTVPGESTTINDAETTTLSPEECLTTEGVSNEQTDNVQNSGNRDIENMANNVPVYINDRQWNQRINDPVQPQDIPVQTNQGTPDFNGVPSVLRDQSTNSSDKDAETLGNEYKSSPDHMENRNPKISAITNFREKI